MSNTKVVAGLAGVSLLVGCGSPTATSPSSPSASLVSGAGAVSVTVRLVSVGGAEPPMGSPSLPPTPIAGGQIQARRETGGDVLSIPVTATTNASGVATFELWPGRYGFAGRLSATGGFYCETFGTATIAVRSGQRAAVVTVECPVP